MKYRILFIFILYIFSFSFIYASVPPTLPSTLGKGVYPIKSTLEEVGEGVWIVNGTDGRTYQITGQNDSGEVVYESLTGKYDTIFEFFQELDDHIDVPSLGFSSSSKYKENEKNAFPNANAPNGFYFYQYWGADYELNGSSHPSTATYTNISDFQIWYDGGYHFSFKYEQLLERKWFDDPYRDIISGPGVVTDLTMYPSTYDGFYYNCYFPFPSNTPDGYLREHYTGWGDPENGLTAEQDPYNPDNPDYDPQLIKDVEDKILTLNMRIKIDWSEFWPEFDKRIPFDNNIIIPDSDDKNNPFNVDEIDWEKEVSKEDSWFVKLLKSISKFLLGLIVPGDVEITNSDGTKSKQNFFTFEFNSMHTDLVEKIPATKQVTTLTDTFIDAVNYNSGVDSFDEEGNPVQPGAPNFSIEYEGQSVNLIDFSSWGASRSMVHGIILFCSWFQFVFKLPKRLQKLVKGL